MSGSAPSLLTFMKRLKLHQFRRSYPDLVSYCILLCGPCGSSLLYLGRLKNFLID